MCPRNRRAPDGVQVPRHRPSEELLRSGGIEIHGERLQHAVISRHGARRHEVRATRSEGCQVAGERRLLAGRREESRRRSRRTRRRPDRRRRRGGRSAARAPRMTDPRPARGGVRGRRADRPSSRAPRCRTGRRAHAGGTPAPAVRTRCGRRCDRRTPRRALRRRRTAMTARASASIRSRCRRSDASSRASRRQISRGSTVRLGSSPSSPSSIPAECSIRVT